MIFIHVCCSIYILLIIEEMTNSFMHNIHVSNEYCILEKHAFDIVLIIFLKTELQYLSGLDHSTFLFQ